MSNPFRIVQYFAVTKRSRLKVTRFCLKAWHFRIKAGIFYLKSGISAAK